DALAAPLPPFPTRRSSDLRHYAVVAGTWEIPVGRGKAVLASGPLSRILGDWNMNTIVSVRGGFPISVYAQGDVCNCAAYSQRARSEEHTSELQSRSDLVCR